MIFGQIHMFMRTVGNMKTLKIRIFTFMTFLTLLMSIEFVTPMGLLHPTSGLRLVRGDTGDFTFAISAKTDTTDMECTYSISAMDPLIITFEEETTVTIKADTKKRIYASVSVPANAEIKRYTGELVVNCKPLVRREDITGSLVNRVMTAEFSVNVVEKVEEKRTPTLPPKEMPAPPYNLFIITLIIIIIILVIVGYVWSERKKEQISQ